MAHVEYVCIAAFHPHGSCERGSDRIFAPRRRPIVIFASKRVMLFPPVMFLVDVYELFALEVAPGTAIWISLLFLGAIGII